MKMVKVEIGFVLSPGNDIAHNAPPHTCTQLSTPYSSRLPAVFKRTPQKTFDFSKALTSRWAVLLRAIFFTRMKISVFVKKSYLLSCSSHLGDHTNSPSVSELSHIINDNDTAADKRPEKNTY